MLNLLILFSLFESVISQTNNIEPDFCENVGPNCMNWQNGNYCYQKNYYKCIAGCKTDIAIDCTINTNDNNCKTYCNTGNTNIGNVNSNTNVTFCNILVTSCDTFRSGNYCSGNMYYKCARNGTSCITTKEVNCVNSPSSTECSTFCSTGSSSIGSTNSQSYPDMCTSNAAVVGTCAGSFCSANEEYFECQVQGLGCATTNYIDCTTSSDPECNLCQTNSIVFNDENFDELSFYFPIILSVAILGIIYKNYSSKIALRKQYKKCQLIDCTILPKINEKYQHQTFNNSIYCTTCGKLRYQKCKKCRHEFAIVANHTYCPKCCNDKFIIIDPKKTITFTKVCNAILSNCRKACQNNFCNCAKKKKSGKN